MWNAAISTYEQEFERNMEVIKASNKSAYDHIIKLEKKFWTKSAFSTYPKCDTVLNNMLETFNSVILEQRELPMTTMVDGILTYMMNRWQANRSKILKYSHDICLRIRSRLDKYAMNSGRWVPVCSAPGLFQVNKNYERFVVNLNECCSCRRWQISGIPCTHAIACMKRFGDDVGNYIPQCYKRQAYETCYAQFIKPMNGPNLWSRAGNTDVLPPPLPEKKIKGKLTKKRRKEAGEKGSRRGGTQLTTHGKEMTCGNCLQKGHHRRSCKAPTHPNARPPRRRWVSPAQKCPYINSNETAPAQQVNEEPVTQDVTDPAQEVNEVPVIQDAPPLTQDATYPAQQMNELPLTQNAPPSTQDETEVADNVGIFEDIDWELDDQVYDEWESSQEILVVGSNHASTHASITSPPPANQATATAASLALSRQSSCQKGKLPAKRGRGRSFNPPRSSTKPTVGPSTFTRSSSRL